MALKKSGLVAFLGSALFFGGCPDPVSPPIIPEDTAPVVSSFVATPQSTELNVPVNFGYSVSDKEGLDSLVVSFGDGAKSSVPLSRKTSFDGVATHTYTVPGTKTASLTVYADGKTAESSVPVGVNANLPPSFKVVSLPGVEGAEKVVSRSSFVSDPENKPVTLSVKTPNNSVVVSITSDSVKYKGVNSDVNGSFPVVFEASDGVNTVEKSVNVVLDPKDDIVVSVSDFLSGTMSDSMAIKGPFTSGKGVIDGVVGTLKSDGTFSFPKLSNSVHAGSFWVTNGKDSSYVAKYAIPKGDGSFNAKVYSNAGSGMNMKLLFDFFDETNFESKLIGTSGAIKGIDFNNASSYKFWIAQLDTVFENLHYVAFTPQQQATIKGWLESDILKYLPVSKQPGIYLASFGEKWPAGTDIPLAQGTILNLKRTFGTPGGFQTYGRNGILNASILSVTWDNSDAQIKSAVVQENLSALAAPYDVGGSMSPLKVPLSYKTCLHETNRTNYLTPIDVKLLLIPVYVGAGKKALDYFGMPF